MTIDSMISMIVMSVVKPVESGSAAVLGKLDAVNAMNPATADQSLRLISSSPKSQSCHQHYAFAWGRERGRAITGC
jgi:hypothetical protein